jgi:putative membrane protein
VIGLTFGVASFVGIIVWQGVGEVAAALGAAGAGLLVVAAFHLVPLAADGLGWWALLARGRRPPARTVLYARWVGEGINSVLPVMQIGGAVVRWQLLARAGVDTASAAASVVVDVTLLVATQALFTLLGLAVLAVSLGGARVGMAAALGTGLMATAVAGFVLLQRWGLFGGVLVPLARRVSRREWAGVEARAAEMDARVEALYRDRHKLLVSAAWHLASWILGAGETWLALRFLGSPVGLVEALLLESLGQAVRSAAFAVPGGIGVQEGGYLVLGGAVGLAPETAIALSLARRVRELAVGLPALIAWQLGSAGLLRVGFGRREASEA